jgi:hypothetical protein
VKDYRALKLQDLHDDAMEFSLAAKRSDRSDRTVSA